MSSGPNKKSFSLKEKKPGDSEGGQGPEDTSFQHPPLSKPVVRAAAGTLLNKRCGRSFLWVLGLLCTSQQSCQSMAGKWVKTLTLEQGGGGLGEGEEGMVGGQGVDGCTEPPGSSLISLSPVSHVLVLASDVCQCIRNNFSLKRSKWL